MHPDDLHRLRKAENKPKSRAMHALKALEEIRMLRLCVKRPKPSLFWLAAWRQQFRSAALPPSGLGPGLCALLLVFCGGVGRPPPHFCLMIRFELTSSVTRRTSLQGRPPSRGTRCGVIAGLMPAIVLYCGPLPPPRQPRVVTPLYIRQFLSPRLPVRHPDAVPLKDGRGSLSLPLPGAAAEVELDAFAGRRTRVGQRGRDRAAPGMRSLRYAIPLPRPAIAGPQCA